MTWLPGLAVLGTGMMAATEALPGIPIGAQYGIMTTAIVVLASGKVLVPVAWLRDEQKARERAEKAREAEAEKVRTLNETFQEKAIPALIKASEAVALAQETYRRER